MLSNSLTSKNQFLAVCAQVAVGKSDQNSYNAMHVKKCMCFLHNKDIIHYFGSSLVNSGHFQLPITTSTIFLLVEPKVIKHGHHIVSCSYQHPQRVVLFLIPGPVEGAVLCL